MPYTYQDKVNNFPIADPYIEIEGDLTEVDLESMLAFPAPRRVQSRTGFCEGTARIIDRFLEQRPETILRFFGWREDTLDMGFLECMPHVRKLHVNAMKAVTNAQSISALPCLRQLVFEVYEEKGFSFLDGAAEGLTALSIDSAKPSVDLARLCRFGNLTALRLHNAKENIAALGGLKRLDTLALHGITPENLGFAAELPDLESFELRWGKLHDFSALVGKESLRHVKLMRVTELADVSFLGTLPNLEWLDLIWLPKIAALPNLRGAERLWRVELDTMRGMLDFSEAEHIPALKAFQLVDGASALRPESFLPVLRNPSVEGCRVFVKGAKKMAEIEALTERYGKSRQIHGASAYKKSPFW